MFRCEARGPARHFRLLQISTISSSKRAFRNMGLSVSVRQQLNELYWESPWMQWLYSTGALLTGRMLERSSNPYSSLIRYCNAARRVRDSELRANRLGMFSDFLKKNFAPHPPRTFEENVFVKYFLQSTDADRIRSFWRQRPSQERVNLRGNLILLKAPSRNESGVLLLTYTGACQFFLVNFDLKEISKRYVIVLEPSWATFPEPYMGFLSSCEPRAICEMISEEAADAVREAQIPLTPIAIGAQDWVDTEVFKPLNGVAKDFDVVMVATFAPWKRHAVLFRAMRQLRPRRLRVALIGGTWERTRKEFEEELRRYDVQDDCTIFQRLSPAEVNNVLNRSKIKVLLTKIEGANRALSEAFSANVPCVVYKHILGPRRTDINPLTGVYADDDELADVLLKAIHSYKNFAPRKWYLQNSGYQKSTARLNEALRIAAQTRNENWTAGIVQKVNRPEVQYANTADRARLAPAWEQLERYLSDLGRSV
jgi:glycosyltransferase involved in cell wall biosynthesis